MSPEDIDRAESAIIDLVTIGVQAYPLAAIAVPVLQSLIKYEMTKIRAGLADGSVVPDGRGGFVSKEWADDPRHALNRDGTFKIP